VVSYESSGEQSEGKGEVKGMDLDASRRRNNVYNDDGGLGRFSSAPYS
jgi:hypothetical protein